ncbi:MAG: hypothetical protein CBD88_08270 [Flavobacteriales bacterium TMED228]|jgi:hypothetical protein|nr:MAG: hypothetical protein CBD88_08270 [Flavobacteriales bacterium TMED228]|tara:strand:- start:203 stop:706 length:504 start_codon:yes stop_codon:yes gene_type:complete
MATTTFTGTVRSNGNGNRANYAGSMSMVAQFYVPSTVAAAGTDAQVSSTDTAAVQLPKGSIVDYIIFAGAAAAGGKIDIGFKDVIDGTTFVDTDGFVDNGAADDAQEMVLPSSGTAGNDLGLTEMTYDVKIVAGVDAAGQAGTLSGTIFYHMQDEGNQAGESTPKLT